MYVGMSKITDVASFRLMDRAESRQWKLNKCLGNVTAENGGHSD